MYPTFRTLGIGLLLALFLRSVPSAYARIVISEVMWPGTDLSSADEWVEMACIEDTKNVCDVSGWSLTYVDSKNSEQTMLTFASGTIIGSGAYVLVSNFSESESRLAIAPSVVTPAVSLPNTKLLLRLRDALHNVMDEVDDGIGDPFAGLNLSGTGMKASMERLDLLLSGTLKSNWATATACTNLDAGFPVRGTPGSAYSPIACGTIPIIPSSSSSFVSSASSVSSASPPPISSIPNPPAGRSSQGSEGWNPKHSLLITELLPNPEGSDTEEWIEIGNLGSTPVLVAGLLLTTGTGSGLRKFTIPSDASGGILLPQAFRSFRGNQTHLSILNAGSAVSLYSGETIIDSVTYPAIPEGMSYGRSSGSGSWRVYCIPTERAENLEKPVGLSIAVQSGNLEAIGDTSVNLSALTSYGPALTGAQCRWEYPDGFAPETCNPSSHALSMTGVHLITLRAQLACGREERATVTVRIRPEDEQAMATNSVLQTYPKQSVIISAALPFASRREGTWVSLRNTSDISIDLSGFSLHGGLIPNDRHTFSGVILLPREERRFPGGLLRMDFPDSGKLLLHDPGGGGISVLGWDKSSSSGIIRPPVVPLGSISVQVLRVVDGDSLEVALLDTKDPEIPPSILHRWSAQELSPSAGLRVRLIGVDAPELFEKSGDISESGLEALNFVRALIENEKIELQFDSIIWDRYERVLAYAKLPGDDALLQQALLEAGYAIAERGFAHPKKDFFIAVEHEARKAKKGLWARHGKSQLFTSADPTEHDFVVQNPVRAEAKSSVDSPTPAKGVVISEVYPFSDGEWIEIYNMTDSPQTLNGLFLDDAEEGSKPWRFPENTVIETHQYLVLEKEKIKLVLNDDADTVRLLSTDGTVLDALPYGKMKKGQSVARVFARDGKERGACVTEAVTPGRGNQCAMHFVSLSSQKKSSAKKIISKGIHATSAMKVKWVTPKSSSGQNIVENFSRESGSLLSGLNMYGEDHDIRNRTLRSNDRWITFPGVFIITSFLAAIGSLTVAIWR